MKTQRFLIAGGNTTMLVEDFDQPDKTSFARKILDQGQAEQVGFISTDGQIPSLEMMGDELCINAIIAFAKKLGNEGSLLASGLIEPANYRNLGDTTSVVLKLPIERPAPDIVLLGDIGYRCVSSQPSVNAYELRDLARRFRKPAFGLAVFAGKVLRPYVYVAKTDSVVCETACGSGSIATSLVTGETNIQQTTGKFISVLKKADNQFTVSAKVIEMKK